ncbi:MAG: DNA polymerase III subunit gamma/tau [Christensenella sp.]
MAYKTLYRVFRPKTFDEVYGQQHITDILKNQIMSGQTSHAYLFYGPRGTGKTSTAKIFANALNCLDPQNGNPCGRCEVCKSFASDAFVDIVEIDAASNNSVDNVRDIREKVSLLPAFGKFKVYIIDEVHMLSAGAFNALLKTLEEPPPHAVFILATTEIRKLPATILSRCQRYDFKRISEEDIIARLREVAEKTDVTYDEEALGIIAQSAEGAMRDALSVMDQCIAGQTALTTEHVNAAMGIAEYGSTQNLCDAIIEENPTQALKLLQQMLKDGIEAHNILRDIITECSLRLAHDAYDAYKCSNLLRVLEVFIYNQSVLRYAVTPDAVLIAAVTRATINTTDIDTKDMELRIKKLEARVERFTAGIAADGLAGVVDAAKKEHGAPEKLEPIKPVAERSAIENIEKAEKAEKAEIKEAEERYIPEAGEALQKLRASITRELPMLAPAVDAVVGLEVKGNLLKLVANADDSALVGLLMQEAYQSRMNEVTAEIFGHSMVLEAKYEKKEEGSMEQQLFDLFGKDKVVIK